MSIKIEDHLPVVQFNGLNTDKAVTMGSTLAVTGAITAGAGLAVTGALSATDSFTAPQPIQKLTITTIDAQNGTLTAAALLGGIVKHNSKTGAGTITFDTGALLSATLGSVVGTTIRCLYYNYGNQTATLTTAASGTTIIGGTAAVTTGKHSEIIAVCTAADTWDIYLQTLM